MTEQQLLRLKKDIEDLDRQISRDEGVLEQMEKELKDKGFRDLEAVEKEIQKLTDQEKKLERELDKQVQEIRELMV